VRVQQLHVFAGLLRFAEARMNERMKRAGWMAAGGVLLCLIVTAPVAWANDPLGACCRPGGECEDLQGVQCEPPGGTFIGEGTACEQIDCTAPVAVPVLSIAALVGMFGALGSLGIYGVVKRRRPGEARGSTPG